MLILKIDNFKMVVLATEINLVSKKKKAPQKIQSGGIDSLGPPIKLVILLALGSWLGFW